MFEGMPVLCGAVLGLLFVRAHITQRTLLCLGVLAACAATASSGEIFDAPELILVDFALVSAGVLAARVLTSLPRRTRFASGSATSRVHRVGAPHLRSTQTRSVHVRSGASRHTRHRRSPLGDSP